MLGIVSLLPFHGGEMHVLECLRDIVWVLVQWRKPLSLSFYIPSTTKQVWEMIGDFKAEGGLGDAAM